MSRFAKPWYLWTWDDLGETPAEHDYKECCDECSRYTEDYMTCERKRNSRKSWVYICKTCWPDHVAECDECREAHE